MAAFNDNSATLSEVPAAVALDPVLANAPHRIGKVTLVVKDLERVAVFYERVLGLERIERNPDFVRLGTAEHILLELRSDPGAKPRNGREAGLFHTAFLLPSRSNLGAWLKFAAKEELAILGASDHLVSEAVYLADPEGNGIEIYADRPSSGWPKSNGIIQMPSNPLDIQNLVEAPGVTEWREFPAGGIVGHVHLQVGEIAAAEAFYGQLLGFDITCRYPGGSFYGSGGYHHQLATNIWNSRGASARLERTTGLADVEIITKSSMLERVRSKASANITAASISLRDPWGTSITLTSR